MSGESIREAVLASAAQQALRGDGSFTGAPIAREVGMSVRSIAQHLRRLVVDGMVDYELDAPHPPQRYRFTALGAVCVTTPNTPWSDQP